ncbi:MAG: hypothetical protein ABII64_10245 [Elusimicrobiota bacterium]
MNSCLRFAAVIISLLAFSAASAADLNWDNPALWDTSGEIDGVSRISLSQFKENGTEGIRVDYELLKEEYGWVVMRLSPPGKWDPGVPFVFSIKADASCVLEIKMIDKSGANYVKRIPIKDKYREWTEVVVYFDNLEYGWGGDGKFVNLKYFAFAFSGPPDNGTVWLSGVKYGKKGIKSSFGSRGGMIPDPNRNLPGYGFNQRQDRRLAPQNLRVLGWLKRVQDKGTPDKKLIPSADIEDTQIQTFNNALVAMAFIVEGEQERAERILDFFANATKPDNDDPTLQNFFYKGEARGFFQQVVENAGTYHDDENISNRWMGDNAWLLIAYRYYDKEYNNHRYDKIEKLLKELLIFWYKPAKVGGYIQHGWRSGDSKLHEDYGHAEGNLDAYAALRLCGEKKISKKIRKWLDNELGSRTGLPLDNYTWRVLAKGRNYGYLLNYVDHDLRYLKTIDHYGNKVKGVWHKPDDTVNNVWVDGVGQLACAFFVSGDWKKGNFYANQMDDYLIDRGIDDKVYKALPYTLNKQGGIDWVILDRGFASCAAWYIFAKNRFNPMRLNYYYYDNHAW